MLTDATVRVREGIRRDVLLQATRLFGQRGYDATSLRDIAAAAGCSKAAILYHFPNKAAVFSAAMEPGKQAMSELLAQLDALPPDRRREFAITGIVDLVISHRELIAGLSEALATRERQRELPALSALGAGLHHRLSDPDDPEDTAMVLFALLGLNAYCRQVDDLDDETLRRHLERALRALLSRS